MNTTKKIDGRKNPNRKPWTPNLNFRGFLFSIGIKKPLRRVAMRIKLR